MKPTIAIISQEGIVPITSLCDSVGPMAKSVEDLANLMDVLVDPSKTKIPDGGYLSAVTAVWEGLKIGSLDPEKYQYPESERRSEPAAESQMVNVPHVCHQFALTQYRNRKREKHTTSLPD